MNIAILGIKTYPAFAGADRVVEKIIEHMKGTPCCFHVYVMKGKRPAQSDQEQVRLIEIPSVGGKHIRPFVYFLLSSLHCLFNCKVKIAHVHNSDFGLFCPLLRLRPGLRVIGTFHGNPYLREKWGRAARQYLRLSEFFFARCCHQLTTVAKSKIQEVAPSVKRKLVYIPNGTEAYWESTLDSTFDCSQYGLEAGTYALFACGRLDATKGLHHFLKGRAIRGADDETLVIGDFSHDPSYTASILDEYGQAEHIVFIRDLLSRDTLIDAVRKCRVFVFPSEVEAMSMMLLEAISCRVPVICSDIAENVEIVGEGYAYLFRSGSAEDLAEKLALALSDADSETKAERLYTRCMEQFSWPALAARYRNLYAGTENARE